MFICLCLIANQVIVNQINGIHFDENHRQGAYVFTIKRKVLYSLQSLTIEAPKVTIVVCHMRTV